MFSVVIVVALCLLASVAHSSPDSEPFDKSVCSLPPEVGICNASIRKYYYDHSSKTCKEFIYGGCRGNGNRFDTIEECQAACSGV